MQTSAHSLELSEFQQPTSQGEAKLVNGLALVKNLKLNLVIKLGELELSIGELSELKENKVLKLNYDLEQAIDLLVDNQVVARGLLVAVDDHYGVQITEINNQLG